MRTENWNGYVIRFVEIDGEWYAILKDICSALGLRTDKVADRLDPDILTRVEVPGGDVEQVPFESVEEVIQKGARLK